MTVTDAQLQALLVLEVGDTPDNRLSSNVATYWALNATYGTIFAPLQRWYTKRDLIDLAAGYYRDQIAATLPGGATFAYQQRFAALMEMRGQVIATIANLYQRARASRGIAMGQITQTQPELPPPLQPQSPTYPYANANDPVWQGDVYASQVVAGDTVTENP